jgi:hypothetical protein
MLRLLPVSSPPFLSSCNYCTTSHLLYSFSPSADPSFFRLYIYCIETTTNAPSFSRSYGFGPRLHVIKEALLLILEGQTDSARFRFSLFPFFSSVCFPCFPCFYFTLSSNHDHDLDTHNKTCHSPSSTLSSTYKLPH